METTLKIDVVQGAIDQAAQYLINSIQDNGMFRYRINTNANVRIRPKYNILHHAGCMYALSMYHQRQPSKTTYAAIQRIGRYLCKETIQPVPGESNILAVWSRPDIHKTTKPLQAKLAGTSIGLLALLSWDRFKKNLIPLAYLQALGRFITYMQTEETFYSAYVPLLRGRTDPQPLHQYPTEAVLGLVMLYEKDRSDLWLTQAYDQLAYLAQYCQQTNNVSADPWILLATQKILSFKNLEGFSISKELLINHAIQICEIILQQQVNDLRQPHYDGSFGKDGRTVSTAIWLEGLLAALSFLPKDEEITPRVQTAVTRGISFLLKAQITDGEFVGAIPRAVRELRPRHAADQQATEVRIDYVQHAMNAWMQYLALVR